MSLMNRLIDRLSEEKRALYYAFVESNSDIEAQFQYLLELSHKQEIV